MKITVNGTGYVGLVTGACLADIGHDVVCLDIDHRKIAKLCDGEIPIHEPGLAEVVQRNTRAGRLRFTTSPLEAARHGLIQFIAVATPPNEDGSADLSYVLEAARNIGRHIADYKVIVDKSTVPVGTAEAVRAVVIEELECRGVDVPFAVVSNPEFLKEGAAVQDFSHPDRVVIGTGDEHAVTMLRALYAPFLRNHDRLLVMDIRSAEFTKYAANAMLATRISFMNELSLLAEKVGADIEMVRQGIGSDRRIGYHFLYAGCGYGGSCFPKDVKALVNTSRSVGVDLGVLSAVQAANERQKRVIVDKIVARFGNDLSRLRFALWGLAFKPNTDDMREATSRVVIDELLRRGAAVAAYDPVAMREAGRAIGERAGLTYAASRTEALDGADALIVLTEWREFRSPDFDDLRSRLKQPVIFDGRNLYEPALMRAMGIEYWNIGRAQPSSIDVPIDNDEPSVSKTSLAPVGVVHVKPT